MDLLEEMGHIRNDCGLRTKCIADC